MASILRGVVFLCLPSEVGFMERSDAGIWQPVFDAIYAVDGRANAVPSFHVIYTSSVLLAVMDVATRRLRIVYVLWLVAVCLWTVLTHRHHLVDVATGLAIAFGVRSLRLRSTTTVPSTKSSSWSSQMRSIISLAILILVLSLGHAAAQDSTQAADHAALRKLKDDVVGAINSRNLTSMDSVLHKPFLSTVVTQDSFNDSAKMAGLVRGSLFPLPPASEQIGDQCRS